MHHKTEGPHFLDWKPSKAAGAKLKGFLKTVVSNHSDLTDYQGSVAVAVRHISPYI